MLCSMVEGVRVVGLVRQRKLVLWSNIMVFLNRVVKICINSFVHFT